ncbi:MAG: hydantoinase/oxoprolinase family protein [Hyphomicrobiales bacterium]|nr:hydantoinase/oxoprolinase family protein [Hyphomicrobiales bacterium]
MKLAVDIGGTFTDVVLEGPDGSASTKVLTTHDAPVRGVLEGVRQLLEETATTAGDVELVIHGTTLATNALIERKGARTALIATEGFRDSLEIAHEHRFEQYDLYMERPEPLVPRHLRLTVPERVAADGSVLLPPDEDAVEALVPTLRQAGIESVGICFLHSYINPDHERRVGEMLQAAMPELSVTLSSRVCPEIREYERMSTTCANAYIQPLMAGYLHKLEEGLAETGLTCPLLMMMSSGGITTVQTAVAQPIRLIESGPAGGVIFSQSVAAECGVRQALSFDMGGTTAKLTLIDDLVPQYGRSIEVARQYRFLKGSGLPIRIPVIDMVEIGAGGGSIARVDALKRITIGPDSAGSTPGPACYGRGGIAPTVTDGDVILGAIDPDSFAGGKIALDRDTAEAAIDAAVGSQLGLDTVIAAAGISEIVDETMASAARVHAVEHGKDTAERTLIAMGGAAPLHCARLAEKLDIDRIIVPVGAGVGSAHGFLRAPISYEVVRTRLSRLDQVDPHALSAMFDGMHAEAEAVVRLGAPDAPLVETREAFMRYRGQGHEIAVPLPVRDYDACIGDELRQWFETQYARVFGRVVPGLEVEALTWALTLSTEQAPAEPDPPPTSNGQAAAAGRRSLFDPGSERAVEAAVYDRSAMTPGCDVEGPAVIVEAETATVVPSGFRVVVSARGHLILTRQPQSA